MPPRTPLDSEAIEFEHKMEEGLVSIVVVCYNNPDLLRKLLPTIAAQTYESLEVICVLNGSDKETKAYLEGRDVAVINPGENLWYSGGNDRGVEAARGEYIFILNPDTRLEPETIERLVDTADSNLDTAVFAPKVLTENGATIDSVGMRLTPFGRYTRIGAGEPADGRYDEPAEIVLFDGAAVLIRRKSIEDVGLFDRQYETFQETHDLAFRLYRNGWRAVTVPDSVVYHMGGETYEGLESRSEIILYYSTRNDLLTIAKHHHWLFALFVLPLHILGPLKTIGSFLVSGEVGKAAARSQGLIDGIRIGIKNISSGMPLDEQIAAIREYPQYGIFKSG